MDELTQENDLLKNQGTERKLRRRTSKMHSSKPGRIGSVLSDYVNKPNLQRRLSSSGKIPNWLHRCNVISVIKAKGNMHKMSCAFIKIHLFCGSGWGSQEIIMP